MFHRMTRVAVFALALGAAPLAAQDDDIIRAHGYSFYGELSYPEDFHAFQLRQPRRAQGRGRSRCPPKARSIR